MAEEMSVSVATKKFRDFCVSELNGKCSSKGWTKIDGSRLCNTCARKKRRTLYALINEGSAVYLKCFRASCELKRFATYQDFEDLGFTNKEAIKVLMDRTNRLDIQRFGIDTRPIIVSDRIISREQRDYFKKRTGIELTPSDIFNYRIIPNIHQVMCENFDEDDPILEKFNSMNIRDDKNAVTFATDDYTTLSYRHTSYNQKIIFNTNDEQSNNGYTLIRTDTIKDIKTLVFSEGIFDLINIYNFYGRIDGALYCATLGFQSFHSDIIHWYLQHLDTVDRIIIFADADKELPYGNRTYDDIVIKRLFNNINKEIDLTSVEICLAYNKASKDFGDRSEPINGEVVVFKQKNEPLVINWNN